jgi:hypothetical protein
MNSKPSASANADLEEAPGLICTDQHDQVIHGEHSDRMAVGVEHVQIADPVLAGTLQYHGIHDINLA